MTGKTCSLENHKHVTYCRPRHYHTKKHPKSATVVAEVVSKALSNIKRSKIHHRKHRRHGISSNERRAIASISGIMKRRPGRLVNHHVSKPTAQLSRLLKHMKK